MSEFTVAQLAAICGGQAEGETSRLITGANTLQNAAATDLSYVENEKSLAAASSSRAGALLVSELFSLQGSWALIHVSNPRLAFARAVKELYPSVRPKPAIHSTAVIASSAAIPADCYVGLHVTIGEHVRLGENCFINAGCTLGDEVILGDDAYLHPNVTIYRGVRIGRRAVVHAGCVIGADGFGFSLVEDHWEKFPQVGTVEIGDDVEIGANACIDRAALGATLIGDGTKIDNLVHIAHNCVIGKHVVIAAQTGLSGSVTVGDYAALGGQVGIGPKATIASKAHVAAKSGIVTSQHVTAGEPVWGAPARPLRQHLKGLANVAKLSDTLNEFKQMRKKLEALEEAIEKFYQQS